MGSAADRVARRRAKARETGLCITCCKALPDPGRTVCRPCTDAARDRNVRRRDEKRAYALALGRDPVAAIPLFKRILATYREDPAQVAKVVETLLQGARQLYNDSRTEEALSAIEQAIHVAKMAGDSRLSKLANGRMANYLFGLVRWDEGERYINAMGQVDESDDATIRTTYHMQKAILEAARGKAVDAFGHFERAVHAAKDDADLFHLVRIWVVYGAWAVWLGNIELAKSCVERALFVARQYGAELLVADANLQYAAVLMIVGNYDSARDRFCEALSTKISSPRTDGQIAAIGIPLALVLKDRQLLSKCLRPAAIDFAFRSRMNEQLCAVSGAFAHWYALHGRLGKAKRLIRRVVYSIASAPLDLDFRISVARYGDFDTVSRMRTLISHHSLGSPRLNQASLALADALVAQRNENQPEMEKHALAALGAFETLGFHRYVDVCRELCPSATEQVHPGAIAAFGDMLVLLTRREQQVAELVIKGLPNREIARTLSISKYTVESHVASIMGRLGIRSRHQLGNIATVESLTESQVQG